MYLEFCVLKMNRRRSLRLSLKTPIIKTEKPESAQTVSAKRKKRMLSTLHLRKSITIRETDIDQAVSVERKSQRPSIDLDFEKLNVTAENSHVEPVEKKRKKHRRSSVTLGVRESIIFEESDFQPGISNRRSSKRLSLKGSVNVKNDSEPVPAKKNKKSMPTQSHKDVRSKENGQSLDETSSSVSRQNLVKNTLDCDDLTQIKKYYLDKTVKKKMTPLETIFEDNPNSVGKKKFKRFIPFEEINKRKVRKNYQCQKQLTARKIKSVNEALKNLQVDDSD